MKNFKDKLHDEVWNQVHKKFIVEVHERICRQTRIKLWWEVHNPIIFKVQGNIQRKLNFKNLHI